MIQRQKSCNAVGHLGAATGLLEQVAGVSVDVPPAYLAHTRPGKVARFGESLWEDSSGDLTNQVAGVGE